mmetsp:Transcript_78597/g.163324  ORF Transcript_78597/g.163324 Transcript_78597/m.163324 type:complete len:300 (-) Transcript_78597:776-1675(-)
MVQEGGRSGRCTARDGAFAGEAILDSLGGIALDVRQAPLQGGAGTAGGGSKGHALAGCDAGAVAVAIAIAAGGVACVAVLVVDEDKLRGGSCCAQETNGGRDNLARLRSSRPGESVLRQLCPSLVHPLQLFGRLIRHHPLRTDSPLHVVEVVAQGCRLGGRSPTGEAGWRGRTDGFAHTCALHTSGRSHGGVVGGSGLAGAPSLAAVAVRHRLRSRGLRRGHGGSGPLSGEGGRILRAEDGHRSCTTSAHSSSAFLEVIHLDPSLLAMESREWILWVRKGGQPRLSSGSWRGWRRCSAS